MNRQAVITLEGDELVIDLPNAVFRILVPPTISVYGPRGFPRRVDLDSYGGRVTIEDEVWGEFISYQEKGDGNPETLQEAAEISETRGYARSTFENDYGMAGPACTDTPARGRSPISRAKKNGTATQLRRKAQRTKSQDALFTPEYSPQHTFNEAKPRNTFTSAPQSYRHGPPEVPIMNISLKAMTARDRYRTPTPEQGSSISNTPASRSSDRQVKDLGRIDPKRWTRSSVVEKRRRMSGSESRTALFRFNSHNRIYGTQPLDVKYKGTAGLVQSTVGSVSDANETSIDNDTASTEPNEELSPARVKSKKHASEDTRARTPLDIIRNGRQNDGKRTSSKKLAPLTPKLSAMSRDNEVETSPTCTAWVIEKCDRLKRRKEITAPRKPKYHGTAKIDSNIANREAKHRKSECADPKTSTVTLKNSSRKDDQCKEPELKPLPLVSAKENTPKKSQGNTTENQRQNSKPASSITIDVPSASRRPQIQVQDDRNERSAPSPHAARKENKRPATSPITKEHPSSCTLQLKPTNSTASDTSPSAKHPKHHRKENHYTNPICIGTMTFDASATHAPPPLPSPLKALLSPTKEHHLKTSQIPTPLPITRQPQYPTHSDRSNEKPTCTTIQVNMNGNQDGKQSSVPTPSPTKQRIPTGPKNPPTGPKNPGVWYTRPR